MVLYDYVHINQINTIDVSKDVACCADWMIKASKNLSCCQQVPTCNTFFAFMQPARNNSNIMSSMNKASPNSLTSTHNKINVQHSTRHQWCMPMVDCSKQYHHPCIWIESNTVDNILAKLQPVFQSSHGCLYGWQTPDNGPTTSPAPQPSHPSSAIPSYALAWPAASKWGCTHPIQMYLVVFQLAHQHLQPAYYCTTITCNTTADNHSTWKHCWASTTPPTAQSSQVSWYLCHDGWQLQNWIKYLQEMQ